MFTVSACYEATYKGNQEYEHHPEKPTMFHAWAKIKNPAEVAAQFPRYVGVKAGTDYLSFRVKFYPNEVKKGKNETGIKRIRKFLEIAQISNVEAMCVNSYKTLEDFLSNI